MTQYNKNICLIETIRRAGKISLKELARRWAKDKAICDYKLLQHEAMADL